jgi:nitrite reductase (NADH) large subunit
MPRRLMFNRDVCLACRSCELACAVVHSDSGSLEAAVLEAPAPLRRVVIVGGRRGIEALRCEQCDEPLCAFSCKSGALRLGADGSGVTFDEERCVGCLMCLMVCPYGIHPDFERDRIVRCDVCDGLVSPACVAACPTRALRASEVPSARPTSDFTGRLVVVGSSAAGIAACEAARRVAPGCSITLVTADSAPEYSRPLLPYVLAGSIGREALGWRDEPYVEARLGVKVVRGVRAAGLDTSPKRLLLDNGERVAFDRLVVASGARAARLPIPGARLAGVFPLRDLADLDELERLAQPGLRGVVLGGGNVGLQVAEAFLARGMNVTVVVKSPYLLSQMVDGEVGRRVGDLFACHGLVLRMGRDATAIVGQDRVEAVHLDDREVIPTDVVVIAKGIEPNVEWLQGSGIRIGRGIVVDLCGRASMPDVFAAGDCAEVVDPLTGRQATSGIWPVAYEMGWSAGMTAVGIDRPSRGALRMNASRFFGQPMISIGEVRAEPSSGVTSHVLVNRDHAYRKVVTRDGRLVGALLFGDVSRAGLYYRLYRDGVDLEGVAPEDLDRVEPHSVLST